MEAGEDRSRPSEDCSRPSKRPRLDGVDQSETGGGQETVGCRLLQFQQAWDSVLHSGEVREWVTQGYTIPFSTKPPLTRPSNSSATLLPKARMQVVRDEVRQLVAKQAVRVVTPRQADATLGFYSKLFCVLKSSGNWRPIINLKPMNKFVVKQRFKMETVQDVKELLRPGDYGATVDLQDAFYHISVAERSRRYLRFIVDKTIYEFRALPMGLTCSPRIFTGINRVLDTLFRRRGIRVTFYIDDILVLGKDREDCRQRVLYVLQSLRNLEFMINSSKSQLEPSQHFTYLGLRWDTVSWQISLKPDREVAIRSRAQHILSQGFVTCREVARLVGQVLSSRVAIPLARARIRRTQWELIKSCPDETQLNSYMYLSEEAEEELSFWTNLESGLSLPISVPESTQSLATDVSDRGLGGYFRGEIYSESAPEGHINYTELVALDGALDFFEDRLQPGPLVWRVDNNTALAAIAKQGSTRNWQMCSLAVLILKKAESRGIQLLPIRISSEDNYLADKASKFQEFSDWSLCDRMAERIFERFPLVSIY